MSAQHAYAQHGRTRLRITRPHAASKVREVDALQPDGTWVRIGQVTGLGGITYLAVPAIDGPRVPTIGCTSYLEGARLLAERVTVSSTTVYAVSLNLQTGA